MYIPTAKEFMRDIASKLALNGFKMGQLSDRAKVSKVTLSLASNGKRDLRLETARKISIAAIQMIEENK